jgi:acetyl esterase/lipase
LTDFLIKSSFLIRGFLHIILDSSSSTEITIHQNFTAFSSNMARSREELARMNIINPEFQQHTTRRPVPKAPSFPDTPAARKTRRAHLDSLLHLSPIPAAIPDIVEEKEILVTAPDGYAVPVTVYAPRKPPASQDAGLAVIVLMHEGGWHLGDRKDEELNARFFVRDLACVVVNVEYRLGPEHPFPAGVQDCYAVLRQVCSDPGSIHALANPAKGIVLGGSSAGGNLSAVLAHQAREDRLKPPVTGQWLSVPALIPDTVLPDKYRDEFVSMLENHDDPVVGKLEPGGMSSKSSFCSGSVSCQGEPH